MLYIVYQGLYICRNAGKIVCPSVCTQQPLITDQSGFTIVRPIYLPQNEPVVHFFKKKESFSV